MVRTYRANNTGGVRMNVVQFPGAHRDAPAVSRAASKIKVSDVTPPLRALSVDRIADHLSAGMLSRCHHLDTAGARAEMSEAMASFEGQSSITSRKDRILDMPTFLGPFVLKRKDNLALDGKKFLGHTVRMQDSEKDQFEQEFIQRVASARIATGLKQWQVAEAMGVPQDHYKHWEKKRVMPHHLIGRFCVITRVDPNWLLTGNGQKPLRAPHLVEQEPAPVIRKPRKVKRPKAA